MPTAEPNALSMDELRRSLRSVDPRVVLVPPRVLRRVVRGALGLGRFAGKTPHRDVFVAKAATVLAHADRPELGLPAAEPLPDALILLPEPDGDRARWMPRGDLLRDLWRRLLHARVHLAIRDSIQGEAGLASRVGRLDPVAFAEARSVLVEDGRLVLPADDRSVYVEFAATFAELLAFQPDRIGPAFPATDDPESARACFFEEIDLDGLIEATRPPGASDRLLPTADGPMEGAEEADEPGTNQPSPARWQRLKAQAKRAAARGNNVRAAILKARAARVAPVIEIPKARSSARAELDALARRLRAALGLEADEGTRWRKALPALLDRAAGGGWSRSARLLYDLQKVCSDRERSVYKIDILGWMLTLGRRPLRRPLPALVDVLILKHLRSAGRRVDRISLPEPAREGLRDLIGRAVRRQGECIRSSARGRIVDVLDGVGLAPVNLPERAARRKVVEELLDAIVDRGYLRFGDLRDAISRNQIKLPDLAGPRGFLRGDALLRGDVELARSLEGVYHRGEVYLRALQRASSLAFGTKPGRFLSLVVALPFGAAFVGLEGLQHLVGPIVHAFGGVAPELLNAVSFLSVGALVLGVVNLPSFRRGFVRIMGRVGRALRAIFLDAPAWLLGLPLIRDLVSSRTYTLAWNWLIRPALYVALIALFVPTLKSNDLEGSLSRTMLLVVMALLINTRKGRFFEEIATDGATRLGQRLWTEAIPNVFRGIVEVFKRALELSERFLYTVDEWLRFRGGQGRLTLVAKGLVGLAWAGVAYLARIYINLLIEPQLNPIKHFPVVTVSHKLMIPLIPTLFGILRTPLLPLGHAVANPVAGMTVFLLPGFFGFLVWELKENWRLYAANRPTSLKTVPIGHHGESLARFLRPGFHSGTVPKLFARIRRADRRPDGGPRSGRSRALRGSLHHVEEAVHRFVTRGVLAYLEESRSLGAARVVVSGIDCATNRIVVELRDEGSALPAARLAFEERDRRLHARLAEAGWLSGLGEGPRHPVETALSGLFAMSGVDLVEASPGLIVASRAVPWADWVRAWEEDHAGRGHPPVLCVECGLLPVGTISVPKPDR